MIETPYNMAFFFPSAFVLLCFVKKLTVIGIIGKTHGVNNAANPPKNAKKKIDHNPFSSVFGAVVVATSCVGFSVTEAKIEHQENSDKFLYGDQKMTDYDFIVGFKGKYE